MSYGISLSIYEDNAHGTDSDIMCEVATLVFARTSDSSVRSGVSCETISIDTSYGEEQLLEHPFFTKGESSIQVVSNFRTLNTLVQRTLCSCPVAVRAEGTHEVVLFWLLGAGSTLIGQATL